MHSLLLKKGKHVFFTINIFLNLKDAKGRSTFCIKFKEGFFVFSSCSFVNLFKSKHSDAEVSNGGLSFIILLDRASLSLRRSVETFFFFFYITTIKKKKLVILHDNLKPNPIFWPVLSPLFHPR